MGGNTTGQHGAYKRVSWEALRHGKQLSGLGIDLLTFNFSGAAATNDLILFATSTYARVGEWLIVDALLTADTAVAAAAANGWRFQIRNAGTDGTDTDDLSASGYSTLTGGDGAMAADTPVRIPIEGGGNSTPTNVYCGESEVIQFVATRLAAGADLSAVNFTLSLFVLKSPPGRSAFQQ